MTETFLVRTQPDSSMVNPAHIHITRMPQTRNPNVLNTKTVSSVTAAPAGQAGPAVRAVIAMMRAETRPSHAMI